jgi:predicted DNA binding CopG/RHH family protein
MTIPKKPGLDKFIAGSKADQAAAAVTEPPAGKQKSLLIRLSHETWFTAKQKALQQGMTLHDYVVKAIEIANQD